jgi:hypothetical protein
MLLLPLQKILIRFHRLHPLPCLRNAL